MQSSNFLLNRCSILIDMGNESINQVFAENLADLMERRGVNQSQLSAMSKVSQKTVSNYLNPDQRTTGSKGKVPSAKLTELAMIASALDVDAWELLRPLNKEQRKAYEAIETAYFALNPKPAPATKPMLAHRNESPKVANGRHG